MCVCILNINDINEYVTYFSFSINSSRDNSSIRTQLNKNSWNLPKILFRFLCDIITNTKRITTNSQDIKIKNK